MDIYILKYNNYYNRILKKADTIAEHGEPVYILQDVRDFNPGDGVNTSHLFGSPTLNYNGTGDYAIVVDNGNIVSRWFILDVTFTRQGQWLLNFRRDLLVDFYNDWINTDCFIEKATLNADNPLVFNEENMTFNQVKTNEILLKDKSNCAWIVGYYAKDIGAEQLQGNVPKNQMGITNYKQLSVANINDWEFSKYTSESGDSFTPFSKYGAWFVNFRGKLGNDYQAQVNVETGDTYITSQDAQFNIPLKYNGSEPYDLADDFKAAFINKGLDTLLQDAVNSRYIGIESESKTNDFLSFGTGDIVKTGDHKYYELIITPVPLSESDGLHANNISSGNLFNNLANIASTVGLVNSPDANSFILKIRSQSYYIDYVERTDLQLSYNMSAGRLITEDAPYDIFAIPCGGRFYYSESATSLISIYPDFKEAINIARAIQVKMGESIYDLQLLPYCPVQGLIDNNFSAIKVSFDKVNTAVTPVTNGADNSVVNCIFHVDKSTFTFNIEQSIFNPGDAVGRKIQNQCEKYRLCSPNFNSYFDFSPAKNSGVAYFNIDCCYKPYQPYIHINPNFGGLYGQDFNDPRGLICGGDFSLSQINDQWQSYQIQNKNYQEMFAREIENMEVQNKYQRLGEKLGIGIGAVQGAAAGGATGGMMGGGIGAGIGAAVGGAASLAGGIADFAINEKLRTEAMDYKKDMFGYQLENIQALPNTLTKVSSLNNNNKLFPLLEIYTCTDVEKDAFIRKLAYNGMTVMVIDKPSKYFYHTWARTLSDGSTITNKGYIKGSIIRLEDLEDDFHLVKSISDEFFKGVYIQ